MIEGMNLINGVYLKYELCVFSGSSKSMWLVVFDGKYNYMLFDGVSDSVIRQYKQGYMPFNVAGGGKHVEYYSTFDNALNNLVRVVANNGFDGGVL